MKSLVECYRDFVNCQAKLEKQFNKEVPSIIVRLLGGQDICISNTGISFSPYGDFLTLEEMHEVAKWFYENFYSDKIEKAKVLTKNDRKDNVSDMEIWE